MTLLTSTKMLAKFFFHFRTIFSLHKVRFNSARLTMSSKASRQPLPDGIYTTMITPFLNDDKTSIDWNGIDCEGHARCNFDLIRKMFLSNGGTTHFYN